MTLQKLKEIDQCNKNENCNFHTSKDITTCELKRRSVCRTLSKEHTTFISTSNDDSDYHQEYHTVKVWTGKLKLLKSEQRLYAEKAIYDVLFQAQLGNLNKSSVKINNRIFHTKQQHSIFNSYNNPSERPLEITDPNRLPSQNEEHDYRSSEMVLAESFPTDVDALSSECHVKLDDLSDLRTDAGRKRNKKFLDIVSSLVFPASSSRSQSCQYGQTVGEKDENEKNESEHTIDSEESLDKNYSFSGPIAINTLELILMELSRYTRYLYNCIRNYV